MVSSGTFQPTQQSPQPAWRSLIRPMLLASLALHGLLFFIPTSSEPEPEPPQEEKISLTQLPTTDQPAPAPTVAATPSAAATPRPIVTPVPRPVATPLSARIQAPVIRERPISPRPTAQPQAQPSPTIAQPTPAAAPAQSTQTVPPSSAPATPAPAATQPAPPPDPFTAGFPRYPGAEPGSYGLPAEFNSGSQRTADGVEQVDIFYQQALADAGYEAVALNQSGRNAYELRKDGQARVLTLIPNPDGPGTNIVLSEQPLPANLGSGSVESPAVARFYSDLQSAFSAASLGSADDLLLTLAPADLLSSPNDFYADAGGTLTADESAQDLGNVTFGAGYTLPTPRAGNVRAVVGSADLQTITAALLPQLDAQFDIQEQGTYGGGTAYEVSRTDPYLNETVTKYLVLVPTIDNTKTFVFVWDRPPGT